MSAIAGIFQLNDEPILRKDRVGMMANLSMFPADDIQIWQSTNIFLGCHVQWITPESIGEQLPFYDYERRIAITADAIIDNRQELFEKLNVDRSDQQTIPDSQLILLAYEKWGIDCPKFLIGDFAFMIWDDKQQQLFGARDMSGYRTLYFHRDSFRFAFCSTIKPLLGLSGVEMKLNEEWLAEHLFISGTIDTVGAYMTPYKNVYQIPPANSILINKNHIRISRYASFYPDKKLKLSSKEEYIKAFQNVFQKAVHSRLRTFRKVGAQLSGGLDSGSVVGFSAKVLREKKQQLHTFSYVPPDDFEDFTPRQLFADETPYIKSTVQYVGGITDHYLDFKGKNSYTEIDEMLDIMEMPYKFFENSFWLKGIFEYAGDQHVGILLNGDRGNYSVSWGYAMGYYSILFKRLKWLKLLTELNHYCYKVGGPRLGRLPVVVRDSFPFIQKLYPKDNDLHFSNMINPEFAKRTHVYEKLKRYGIGKHGWVNAATVYDERQLLLRYLHPWNTGNTLISKLSFRHSLWKRDPTNDIRVVKFCLSIPESQYVEKGLDRVLIRKATKNILPDNVRLNQKTRGVQGVDWVHRMTPYWKEFINELENLRSNEIFREYFNVQNLSDTLKKVPHVKPELSVDPNLKKLMRSLITMRFLQKFV
ncbi:asparagine synthase-related protein [Siminovitchia sediminis]|uniref:asparagine synthase (glutamine-hydrolyzing) n=1 Tax=Siminovitchia sediminis TaxID=1274353 RepID=A0ABW4KLB5_9BACI